MCEEEERGGGDKHALSLWHTQLFFCEEKDVASNEYPMFVWKGKKVLLLLFFLKSPKPDVALRCSGRDAFF